MRGQLLRTSNSTKQFKILGFNSSKQLYGCIILYALFLEILQCPCHIEKPKGYFLRTNTSTKKGNRWEQPLL